MLAKPFIFLLTFLLTLANFVFLLLPLSILFFPIYLRFSDFFQAVWPDLLMLFLASATVLTVFYMMLDMMFGLTARRLHRGSKPIAKVSMIAGHQDIIESFEWLKKQFDMDNVVLYIDPSLETINAYAIGGVRSRSVTLTMGLISEIHQQSASESQYLDAIRGIMGHELSHLSNKDFLPGLLAASSEAAGRHVAGTFRLALVLIANILGMIPFLGMMFYNLTVKLYNLIVFITGLFYRYIFMPLYRFIQKWFGRSIEYRCDRESAYAVGGHSMAFALQALGEGSYFSIFSTHPRTKSRINYVKDISPIGKKIHPSLANSLANAASMFLIVIVMYWSCYNVDLDALQTHLMSDIVTPVVTKYEMIKGKLLEFYYGYVAKWI